MAGIYIDIAIDLKRETVSALSEDLLKPVALDRQAKLRATLMREKADLADLVRKRDGGGYVRLLERLDPASCPMGYRADWPVDQPLPAGWAWYCRVPEAGANCLHPAIRVR